MGKQAWLKDKGVGWEPVVKDFGFQEKGFRLYTVGNYIGILNKSVT